MEYQPLQVISYQILYIYDLEMNVCVCVSEYIFK